MSGVGNSLMHRMDYLIKRQGIVSSNIANATTPGYTARDVQFENVFRAAQGQLHVTNGGHMAPKAADAAHKIIHDRTHVRHDGNSVKMDQEMLKLQEVQLQYRMMTQLYSKQVGLHRMILNGGGGNR